MAVVSYRIYCDDCSNEAVIKESDMDDHPWLINSKIQHSGLCPRCNPSAETDELSRENERVPFEDLDNIGDTGAENLREAGIVTRQHVCNASDDEILDVSWVGEGALKSIRQEVQ